MIKEFLSAVDEREATLNAYSLSIAKYSENTAHIALLDDNQRKVSAWTNVSEIFMVLQCIIY